MCCAGIPVHFRQLLPGPSSAPAVFPACSVPWPQATSSWQVYPLPHHEEDAAESESKEANRGWVAGAGDDVDVRVCLVEQS